MNKIFKILIFFQFLFFVILSDNVCAQEITGDQQIQEKPIKIGLALGGGGTRGATHVGVLKVLEQNNIKVSYIAGTSIGAIIGGLYASGMPVSDIEKIITDKSLIRAYFTTPIPIKLVTATIAMLFRLFGFHPYDGIYSGKRFAKFLNNKIPTTNKNIETFPIKFCAVALSLNDGVTYGIDHGNLGQAIEASSAIPLLRKPVLIDNKLFVDGGVVENLPVQRLRSMGADFIIAVDIDEHNEKFDNDHFRKVGSVSDRLVNLQLIRVDERAYRTADFVIHPYLNGINLISTKMSDIKKAMSNGERYTELSISELNRRLAKFIEINN